MSKERLSEQLRVTVTPSTRRRIEDIARLNGLDTSSLLRMYLLEGLRNGVSVRGDQSRGPRAPIEADEGI